MTNTSSRKIVLASRNAKKAREINLLMESLPVEIRPVSDFPEATEVVEDGQSFAENAAKKACQIAAETGHWAIGEDSGLCVDALKGAPGIYSARFSGEDATDEKNNQTLLEKLESVPDPKRTAHYVCHVALANPEGEILISCQRQCNGRIIREAKGENGFGYDPYFLVPEYGKTFGQLPPIVKKCISHRARAFSEFIPQLAHLLAATDQ